MQRRRSPPWASGGAARPPRHVASVPAACGLRRWGSGALEHELSDAAHRLTRSVACGTFLPERASLCLLQQQVGSSPLGRRDALCSLRFGLVLVVSSSLRPHGPQRARLPSPSPAPRACSNPCPLSQRCHPAISPSVVPFSSRLQPFPASGSFQVSQLFASGGQSTSYS